MGVRYSRVWGGELGLDLAACGSVQWDLDIAAVWAEECDLDIAACGCRRES